ncbi:MAG TPA: shikimate kinase [Propionibacteriaceae bacterium]|nr:shikimate kinase [Propionibacteriaceae bacterium]
MTPATPVPGQITTLAIVGAPGAGKSTVGRAVAHRLGIPFIDVDHFVATKAGKSVQDIFLNDGEAAFRAMELEATLECLGQPGVVSLGGGAVMNPLIRRALAAHHVVWLQVSAAQATRRVGLNHGRPLLSGNVRSRLVKLLQERTPLYADVASITIDTNGQKPGAVVVMVLRALGHDDVEEETHDEH